MKSWFVAYAFVVATLAGCVGDDIAPQSADGAVLAPVCASLSCLSVSCDVDHPTPDTTCSCYLSAEYQPACMWGPQPPYCSGEGGNGCHP